MHEMECKTSHHYIRITYVLLVSALTSLNYLGKTPDKCWDRMRID
jgi:hypothetical protein